MDSLFKGGPSELLRPDDGSNADADTEAATVRVSHHLKLLPQVLGVSLTHPH